jgi:hypothetical protein
MKTLLTAFVLATAAIIAPAAYGKDIADAKADKVANCTFVKDVSGQASGKHTRAALGSAMEEARKDAAQAGATHIVWNQVKSANVQSVTGKAYRCPE